MSEIDLVRQEHVDSFNVFSKLYDKVIGHIYEAIVLTQFAETFLAQELPLFYLPDDGLIITAPIQCFFD